MASGANSERDGHAAYTAVIQPVAIEYRINNHAQRVYPVEIISIIDSETVRAAVVKGAEGNIPVRDDSLHDP